MDPQNLAELVSLALTPATVILSLAVVYEWWPEASKIFWSGPKNAQDWFILGVTIAFLGSAFDNIWWGIAWTFSYMEMPHKDWWFYNGVWSNIPSRQMAGTLAAYCHIRASAQYRDSENERANVWARWSLLLGAAFIVALWGMK